MKKIPRFGGLEKLHEQCICCIHNDLLMILFSPFHILTPKICKDFFPLPSLLKSFCQNCDIFQFSHLTGRVVPSQHLTMCSFFCVAQGPGKQKLF